MGVDVLVAMKEFVRGVWVVGLGCVCLAGAGLRGQYAAPPGNGGGGSGGGGEEAGPAGGGSMDGAPGAGAQVTGGSGIFESRTAENFADRIFDVDSDSVDFEAGTLNWKGRTFNLGNNRVLRARFERYLAAPAHREGEAAYQAILDRVLELLSVRSEADTEDRVFEAWNLLFRAAEHRADAGNSLVIANQVYNAWRVRAERERDRLTVAELKRLRRYQEGVVANRERFLEKDFYERSEEMATGAITNERYAGGAGESAFRAADLALTQSRLAAMETQTFATSVQAKLQFQSQVVQFLLQRRYLHALISGGFYRHIFKGSAQDLQVGREEVAGFLPASDFAATIDTLEFLAREAIADARMGMETVDAAYEAGERYAAMERLQETFFLGEHLPAVLHWDAGKKQGVHALYRDVRDLQRLLDNKDYAAAEAVVDAVKEKAPDFPAAQIYSGLRTAQRLSDLSLLTARQAVANGDFEKAERAMQRATEVWPLNPAIRNFTRDMALRADTASQAAVAFDGFYESGNLRELYERRTELGLALMNDASRAPRLKAVVERFAEVDILIAQARKLAEQGNAHAAWDLVRQAQRLEPADPALGHAMAAVIPEVPQYVRALDEAQQAEDAGRHAYAINRYLAARERYPASRAAGEGIGRNVQALMDELEARSKRGE